jgi:hypothetical protein
MIPSSLDTCHKKTGHSPPKTCESESDDHCETTLLRRVNVEAEGGFEAVVHSEDFLKLNQAKVTFCDMWMKN